MHKTLLCCVALLALAAPARAATIDATEAASHVGETDTVCGIVASVDYAPRIHGQPTVLEFGAHYPNETLLAVIFQSVRPAFGQLDSRQGQRACVTGRIDLYRGKPDIILHDPSQLKPG